MRLLLYSLLGLSFLGAARGEDTVNWEMTPRVAGPGQPFRIQIRVTSESTLHTPKSVAKELKPPRGMALSFSGQAYVSANESILNFSGVAPTTEGVFIIPSFPLRFAARIITVPDMPVHVSRATGYQPEAQARAELQLSERTYYVGELIAGTIQFRNSSNETVVATYGFEAEAEGFAFQIASDRAAPAADNEAGLQTSFELTPIRAGESEISLRGIMLVQTGNRPVFNNAGRDRPFALRRRLTVEHVPERGRPADWSGAIGSFTAESVSISNEKPEVGEPISLRAVLTGTGNLDRIITPELSGGDIWDVLPIVERRRKADEQRIFTYTLVPRLPGKQRTPLIRFSSFDPTTKQFQRLEFAAQEVTVTGNAPAKVDLITADPGAPAAPGTRPIIVSGLATPTPSAGSFLAPSRGPVAPLAASVSFWSLNALALLGLLLTSAVILTGGYLATHPEIIRRWRARRQLDRCLAGATTAQRQADTTRQARWILEGLRTGCAALLGAETAAMTQSDFQRILPAAPRPLLDQLTLTAEGEKFGAKAGPTAALDAAALPLLRDLRRRL